LPHSLQDSLYETARLFWFEEPRPQPVYPHSRLAAQYGTNGAESEAWRRTRSAGFYLSFRDVAMSVVKILGWALISLLLVPLAWRDLRVRCFAAALGVCWLGLSFSIFHQPHYAAPMVAPLALLAACSAQTSWRVRIRSVPFGAVVTCAVLAVAGSFPLRAAITTVSTGAPHRSFGDVRAELLQRLSAFDGDQLVIVRYPYLAWRVGEEWVYNSAIIDSQRIVFAHDLGLEQNRALLDYYPRRSVWLIDVRRLEDPSLAVFKPSVAFLARRSLGVAPVNARSHFHKQRYGQFTDSFHLRLHQLPNRIEFSGRSFEHQFVMNLKQQLAFEPGERAVDPDHSQFDQVRRGALDG
jgi:hypothetical protein